MMYNTGKYMRKFKKTTGSEVSELIKKGITLAGRSSSKGTSFLFMEDNGIFDKKTTFRSSFWRVSGKSIKKPLTKSM